MSAYIITEKVLIKRQEGDRPATTTLTIPDTISMALFTEVKFNVYNDSDVLLFSRTVSDGHIEIDGQNINISLEADNTLGRSGKHKWECEISNDTEVITVGEGSFIIKRQLISNT